MIASGLIAIILNDLNTIKSRQIHIIIAFKIGSIRGKSEHRTEPRKVHQIMNTFVACETRFLFCTKQRSA